MYTTFQQLDFQLQIMLFPIWLVAAIWVGRLARRPDQRRLRGSALRLTGWLGLALLAVLLRAVAVALMGGHGLVFIADRTALSMAALLPAALAVAVMTLPRLGRLRRSARGGRGEPLDADQRAAAVAPGLTVPVRAAMVGSLFGFFEKFLPPDNPLALNLLVPLVVMAVVAVALTRAAERRARLTAAGGRTGGRWLVRAAWVVVVLALVGTYVGTGLGSTLPDRFSMMRGEADFGGGPALGHDHESSAGVSVTDLAGPISGEPDKRFTLTAQAAKVRLASGAEVDAWTFNGQLPGPELRAREGDLVEVTVVNRLPKAPVTVHWHGLDVPNREDGVAGVTQDAVAPGGRYVYRFRLGESGTRWYHSHQAASEQVQRGLFGPLTIEPRNPQRQVDTDLPLVLQDWTTDRGKITAFGTNDRLDRRRVAAGSRVRLRLTNASSATHTLALAGVPYRVTALDGTDLNAPTDLADHRLTVGSASRFDLEFVMPSSPVRIADVEHPDAGVLFSPDGGGDIAVPTDGPEFDPLAYGSPATTEFGRDSRFDRTFRMVFDGGLGFYDGAFALRQTINGRVFPDAPMHMVREGELVRFRFINRGEEDHPMHVHGHHLLVLSRNGEAVKGSPVWLDTVLVRPGEIWEVAMRADNPGIWMDHCHNFDHTKLGMVLHLAYDGIRTPFVVGGESGNRPD